MVDPPTPDHAGQEPEWSPFEFVEITDGWSGGYLRRQPDGRLDAIFPGVTVDQARQLWQAARRAKLLQPPTGRLAHLPRTLPYIRDLRDYYYQVQRETGQPPTHKQAARAVADITEATSRKRLQRGGASWEYLVAAWEWWDKIEPDLSH